MNKKSKVVVLPCEAYEEEKIYNLLKAGLKELGGLEALIGKDEKLLLKPNLLKKAEVEKAVITHPVVVGAFARILREEGYANIVLADSCGHGTTRQVIQGTGIDTYLEKYEIPAIDYTKGVHVDYPQGVQAREFILPRELLEADCVISLSKMKTHALERITGAVKNSYGFIYGKNKAIGHTRYPSADSFARMLIDLNQYVKPRLYIMDGITAMVKIREQSNVPVILLTAKSEDTDKILGLNIGADDYVTKPFNPVELQARVKSQLRRYMQLGGGSVRKEVLTMGGIELDDRTKEVTLDGDKVALTRTEYDILKLLMENPGKVFSPTQIYTQVWKDNPYGAENTVAVHIRHLREKIEYNPAEPRYLKAVWGRGYKMGD